MTNEQRAKVLTTEALYEALKMTNNEEIKQVILNELATRQEVKMKNTMNEMFVAMLLAMIVALVLQVIIGTLTFPLDQLLQEVNRMVYEIYVGNDLLVRALSIEDLMYYISLNDLSIIEESEDLENNIVTIDCERRDQEVSI